MTTARALVLTVLATQLVACRGGGEPAPSQDTVKPLRVATYNTSLYTERSGGLVERLENGDEAARKVAAVIQRLRPDILLLNEFDYDEAGKAATLFRENYLGVGQHGQQFIEYAYAYSAPVNTGVPSGMDLNRDGKVGGQGRERGDDAFGYGLHPGQYGMLVLSRFPIDRGSVRTFQNLLWKDLPDARKPKLPDGGEDWYPPEVWAKFRLSSKSHWDVPIETPQGRLHLLASHPTPPVFDGREDRNGLRNFDEIRLWKEYLSTPDAGWLCDDQGRCSGLEPGASFVIAGDLNADPVDGDGVTGAIDQLLSHPRVNASMPPASEGVEELALRYGLPRRGPTRHHTGDFGPKSGTLRLDYVLPSRDLRIADSGVFWPLTRSAETVLTTTSDHRLVWVDVTK